MRRKIVLAAAAVSAAGVASCWPEAVVCLLRMAFPGLIWELSTTERAVAISFDDGPDPVYTPQVLEILREQGVKATFFLVESGCAALRNCGRGSARKATRLATTATRGGEACN